MKIKEHSKTTFPILFFLSMVLGCSPEQNQSNESSGLTSSGVAEIDQIRMELKTIPTNAANFEERKNALHVWERFLMFSGANLTELDSTGMKGHYNIVQPRYKKPGTITNMYYSPEYAAEIDFQYAVLEKKFAEFLANKDQLEVKLERDPSENKGELRNWPSMRCDPASTGFTTQSGPMKGELFWKFPAGHSWYARPAFENGKAYIGSPGISYESYCIDTETGEYIWKSIPKPGWNPYWKNYSSRSCSPTKIIGNHVVIRKMQVAGEHGVPDEHLVFINKETGKREGGVFNKGFLTSCVGYVPFDGNDKYLVYTHGQQKAVDNYKGIYNDYMFDSLKCNSKITGEVIWQQFIGETYAEPLLDGNQVFCGNHAGDFRCIDVKTGESLWEVLTEYPISVAPTTDPENTYISNDEGELFAFNRMTGLEVWKVSIPKEDNAFQQCSRAVNFRNNILIGSANKNLYCISKQNGHIMWQVQLDDWIRSAPVVIDENIYVATLSGAVHKIQHKNNEAGIEWSQTVSDFAIYADLTSYQGDVYAASSNFYLINIDAGSGNINWKTSTFESITDENGNTVLGDLVGQPDYQSSAIIVDGVAYFGAPRFIYAVEVESGKEQWRFETRGQVTGAPVYDNGKIFIGQRGGTPYFYCLDASNGNMLWKKKCGWVWASANCYNNKLYISSENGSFWCVNEDTGETIWEKVTNSYSYPVPAFYKNLVYFGSWHDYYAFDQETGEQVWRFDMGQGRSDSGTALVKDGIIYIQGAASTNFFAIDALSGKEIWRHTLKECNVSPACDGKHLIFCNWEGLLIRWPENAFTYCIDAKTGEKIYELKFAGLSGSVICNDLVFSASSTDPFFKAWDLKTGNIRWKYKMGGRAEESCTTIYGDKAFVVATDGYLYCFN